MPIKAFKIDNITLKNRYIQGPMAGFTDLAMRTLAFRAGASLSYTEMISCNALAYDSQDTIEMVKETQKDIGPVALQLFGYELDHIEKAIHMVEELGRFDFLDFNFGCPVPKVMKQKAGSHLLLDLDYLYKLTRLLVTTSKHPVMVKTRLGFTNPEDIFKIAKVFQDAGAKAIAIHGRTRSELYSGTPHYDLIKEVKQQISIPVLLNGNLNETNGLKILQDSKCDAAMFARATISNPTLFTNLLRQEEGQPQIVPTLQMQLSLLKQHIDLIFQKKEEERIIALEMRSIAPAYFAKFPETKSLRIALVHCQSKQDYLNAIDQAEATFLHHD